jgi:hypothetical protein
MKRYQWFSAASALILLCGCSDNNISGPEPVSSAAAQTETAVTAELPVVTTTAAPVSRLTAEEIAAMPAECRIEPEEIADLDIRSLFTASELPDAVFSRMNGVSYQENPYISRDNLRYLRVLHYDANGVICTGELVCNAAIADDLLAIFGKLYEAQYPIESMRLIDDFDGDDSASMAANNTSCFNYRVIAGSSVLSNHAKGLAVDINPFYNPYVTYGDDGSEHIEPPDALIYADREMTFPMKLDGNDLCCQLFAEYGFEWGGAWDTPKDYQHFEKP